MKARIIFLLILGVLLVTGCTGQLSLTTSPQATNTINNKVWDTPTFSLPPHLIKTITPKTIPTTPALTTTPTPILATITPTIPPEARLKFQSLKILPGVPAEANIDGTFVLISPYRYLSNIEGEYKKNQLILWNAETGEKLELLPEGEYVREVSISSDREWLAYLKLQLHNGLEELSTVITNAYGENRVTIPWENGWGDLSIWLGNQSFIIRRPPDFPKDTTYSALFVLNPFTGERQKLPPNPEDIYNLSVNPLWSEVGETSYDPTLTRRVYLNTSNEVVLEDLENNKILFHLFVPFPEAIPRWSPDGQQFVIANAPTFNGNAPPDYFELFSITKNGQITQLTDLASYYPNADMYNYTWSPDGQKIAFWLSTDPKSDEIYLAILDMTTLDVTQYDIEAQGGSLLSWSPDGKQILTGVGKEQIVHVMVVDLVDGWAAQVAEDMAPMGWLANEP